MTEEISNKASPGFMNAVATAALAIFAWMAFVLIEGERLRRFFDWGDDRLKWFAAGFAPAFTIFVATPLVIVFPIAWLSSRQPSLSYRIALCAAAVWTVLSLLGLWYGHANS